MRVWQGGGVGEKKKSHLVCLRRTESRCDRCVSSELIHETAPRLMIRLVGV